MLTPNNIYGDNFHAQGLNIISTLMALDTIITFIIKYAHICKITDSLALIKLIVVGL